MSNMEVDPPRDGSIRDRHERKPRHHDERERDPARERDKDKDRERHRARSDRPRERDHDRDRERERRDRREHDREKPDRERDHRDRDRTREYADRDRTRDRDRDRDRERNQPRDRDRDRRHRSRSPVLSATPVDPDADLYTASREARAREREDRNTRRDDWDDSARRDWPGRRDLGRRRDRGDRDRERERRRSPSPVRRREPTPDLTDVVSVLNRKRRLTQWDIKPSGYDHMSAEQAKTSGMFPLPGAPRPQNGGNHNSQYSGNSYGGNSHGGNSYGGNGHGGNSHGGHSGPDRGGDRGSTHGGSYGGSHHGRDHHQAHHSQQSTHLHDMPDPSMALPFILSNVPARVDDPPERKRLFVHNLKPEASEDSLVAFFNLQMNGLNLVSGSDACVAAFLSDSGNSALLKFRNPDDATVAVALDGIRMDDSSPPLSIVRPRDYTAPSPSRPVQDGPESGASAGTNTTGLSTRVADSTNKIIISNIPTYVTEEQVCELISTFGTLSGFVLAKDTDTDTSRGFGFAEYANAATVTEPAVDNLNGMELGEGHIRVRLACVAGAHGPQSTKHGLADGSLTTGESTESQQVGSTDGVSSKRVLRLLNMVMPDELVDREEYDEIIEDVEGECGRFGTVLSVKVPRPGVTRHADGVGKVYVKFEEAEAATKAFNSLAGRKFAGRTVVVTYYSEEYFDVSVW